MKSLSRFVLAIVTLGSCAVAGAQPYSQSDQERRERNREEAIAHHERMEHREGTVREELREDKNRVKSKTHHAAQKTRSFTHRQLEKVRNFGERQQGKFPNRGDTAETDKTAPAVGK
jgi:Ni/Co efflux regulator RcnB